MDEIWQELFERGVDYKPLPKIENEVKKPIIIDPNKRKGGKRIKKYEDQYPFDEDVFKWEND